MARWLSATLSKIDAVQSRRLALAPCTRTTGARRPPSMKCTGSSETRMGRPTGGQRRSARAEKRRAWAKSRPGTTSTRIVIETPSQRPARQLAPRLSSEGPANRPLVAPTQAFPGAPSLRAVASRYFSPPELLDQMNEEGPDPVGGPASSEAGGTDSPRLARSRQTPHGRRRRPFPAALGAPADGRAAASPLRRAAIRRAITSAPSPMPASTAQGR